MATQTNTVDPLIGRLHALAKDAPDLRQAVELYEAILPLLRSADLHVTPPMLLPEQAYAKLEQGLPLLHDADLALDRDATGALLMSLARAAERAAPAARQICLALEQKRLDAGELLARAAAGDRDSVTTLAETSDLDPAFLWTLAQYALKPALHDWAKELRPLAREGEWDRGYCFVCGSPATIAELRGNEQSKHLRCGQCGSDWEVQRIRCTHCGNDDHHTLSYFYPEAKRETLRVEVCEQCHGYLKVITVFEPIPSELVPVEDLATVHLDYVAEERGYERARMQ